MCECIPMCSYHKVRKSSFVEELFFSSLEDVTKELNSFMDLFHHLALLFSESEKSPPLLDVDCKGSILGETVCGIQLTL